MPGGVALKSRLAVAGLTLVLGAVAGGAVAVAASLFIVLALGRAWSGERHWLGPYAELVPSVLGASVALLAVAVPAVAVLLVRRVRPDPPRPSGLGAAWGVLAGLLPVLAGAALLRFLTQAFLAGERLDWADAVLAARPSLESLLVLAGASGVGVGAFFGCGFRVRERLAAWAPCVAAAACLGALLPTLWAGIAGAAAPELAADAPLEAAPEPLFTFPAGRFEQSTPAEVDDDGNVYVATQDHLVSLSLDGTERWRVRDGWPADARVGTPVLTREGLVAVAVGEGVFAFDRTGRRAWRYEPAEAGVWVKTLMAAPREGVYASYSRVDGLGPSVLRALGARGEERWSYRSEASALLLSLAGGDRILVSGAEIVALDARGRRVWSHTAPGSSALPAPDGRVYVLGRTVSALAPDGGLLWERPLDVPLWSSCGGGGLATAGDGTLFVSCGLHAFAWRANGTALWRRRLDGLASGPPLLGRDGSVYVAGGSLWALGRDGTVLWRSRTVLKSRDTSLTVEPNPTASPPLQLPDGTLIVGCARNRIYAFSPEGRVRWVYPVGSQDSEVLPVTGFRLGAEALFANAGKLIVFPRPYGPVAAPGGSPGRD